MRISTKLAQHKADLISGELIFGELVRPLAHRASKLLGGDAALYASDEHAAWRARMLSTLLAHVPLDFAAERAEVEAALANADGSDAIGLKNCLAKIAQAELRIATREAAAEPVYRDEFLAALRIVYDDHAATFGVPHRLDQFDFGDTRPKPMRLRMAGCRPD